ncbi:glutathione S-transferase [Escherichia coli]|uniref:Glutathione S-transferase n=1 Tax=Escherichia coli TaxID=562 RepID=A0A376TJE6_ECOLX|nr:glutathione S-transferase [Escherichia coli]
MKQILAGREFGINHDADFLAMNPNGLVRCCVTTKVISFFGNQTPLSAIWRHSTGKNACGSTHRHVVRKRKNGMDWANQTLSNAHRGILMGLVRTPPEERDQAAIDASCKECDALFALLDAELAKVKWFSGDEFGVGDIAIAPFIYNLFNVGLTWTPRPNLQRWYQQLTERPAVRKVVMIPVS